MAAYSRLTAAGTTGLSVINSVTLTETGGVVAGDVSLTLGSDGAATILRLRCAAGSSLHVALPEPVVLTTDAWLVITTGTVSVTVTGSD